MTFVSNPQCYKCGEPFSFAGEQEAACARCPNRHVNIIHGRAATLYDDTAKHLILKFKHADRTDLAPLLANWLKISYDSLSRLPDYIVPVPLHPKRLMKRRYNQATLLAKHLSKQIDVPVCHALKRVRATPPQKERNKYERQKNVEGAFTLNAKHQQRLLGKHVMVLDDVWTTGATLLECAKVLNDHGITDVSIMAVARVKHNLEEKL